VQLSFGCLLSNEESVIMADEFDEYEKLLEGRANAAEGGAAELAADPPVKDKEKERERSSRRDSDSKRERKDRSRSRDRKRDRDRDNDFRTDRRGSRSRSRDRRHRQVQQVLRIVTMLCKLS
jgi:hypothetical protein